jgi:hypothetical protein
LLVDTQLFSDFGAGLASEQVLQLDVELFFLLNNDILFNNLFCLPDKTFLQSLNLLEHLPGVRVGALKFTPSVVVERVLKFLRKSLNLKLFS